MWEVEECNTSVGEDKHTKNKRKKEREKKTVKYGVSEAKGAGLPDLAPPDMKVRRE